MLQLMSAYEGTQEYLARNGVHQDWIELFHNDAHFRNTFAISMDRIYGEIGYDKPLIPADDDILRALSCGPRDVKVVILGNDPIRNPELATGYSFSFPAGKVIDENVGHSRPMLDDTGRSVALLHDALVRAGYLESGGSYDCCHQEWAERGVLLLNASLTYPGLNHFREWHTFIKLLLYHAAKLSRYERMFFLCWGSNAEEVGYWLGEAIEYRNKIQIIRENYDQAVINQDVKFIICIGHHPTYPRDNNNFLQEASVQFRLIKKYYPNIDLFKLTNLKENATQGTTEQNTETAAR